VVFQGVKKKIKGFKRVIKSEHPQAKLKIKSAKIRSLKKKNQ
jgi:hypothetical protein